MDAPALASAVHAWRGHHWNPYLRGKLECLHAAAVRAQ